MGTWSHAARARTAFRIPQEERQALADGLPATANRSGLLAGVAQSVEHVLGKDGVTGAIPVSSFAVIHVIRSTLFPHEH